MKIKLVFRQVHNRRRPWRKRACVPVLCPVCRGHVCDCVTRSIRLSPTVAQLPYDLPY